MKRRPSIPSHAGVYIYIYIDGELRSMSSSWKKAYDRKDGTRYALWSGKRLNLNAAHDIHVHAHTENGMIHGVKREPITADQFDQFLDPEFYAWCAKERKAKQKAEIEAALD